MALPPPISRDNDSGTPHGGNNDPERRTNFYANGAGGESSESIEDASSTTSGASTNVRTMGMMQLAVITFYNVSGGPFGMEPTVRAAGAFYSIIGFAIAPFIWSFPEALMTAELGSTYPEAAGGVAWVEEAFGPGFGWMCGAMGWVAGATDNAIYPVLFLDYVVQLVPREGDIDPWIRFLALSTTCVFLAYINWRGLAVVGDMSLSICFMSMLPFILFCILGAGKVDASKWMILPTPALNHQDDEQVGIIPITAIGGVMIRPYLNNMFWNLNSFDAAGSFAGEVRDAGKQFPRGMFVAVGLVSCCYIFPLLVALGTTDAEQHEWEDGFLTTVVSKTIGPWLGAWIVFAAGISNIALFQAEMSADAFILMGMSERGYLPKIFARRSQYGTPTYGIALGTVVILILSTADLSSLIELLNFNYSLALLIEYCAFIKLRISKPDLHRPYKIPISTTGCIILLIPTFVATLFIMALGSYTTLLYGIFSVALAFSIYHVRKSRNLINYTPVQQSTEMVPIDSENGNGFHDIPPAANGSPRTEPELV